MTDTLKQPVLLADDSVSHLVGRRTAQVFKRCMQCGTCSAVCPWGDVKGHPYNIRKLVQQIEFGDHGFERDTVLYACTTCNLCGSMCPRGIDLVAFVRGCRTLIAETGFFPRAYRETVFSIRTFGNPWSQKRENRLSWKKELAIPLFNKEKDYLLFGCCTNAFDPDRQRSLYAFATLLNQADVSYGVLGKKENCCGESIRKIGAETEFKKLVEENTRLFMDAGVKKIITMSPHCNHSFKTDYPNLQGVVEVLHYTEILEQLIEQQKLNPKTSRPTRVSYHDPCYLGRQGGVYGPPRNIINSIPDTDLVELEKNRRFSRCCGGGGGGIWLGGESGKLANVRVEDAISKEAEILLTACPYCTSMLEYSAALKGNRIKIMELSEFILSCC